MLWGCDDGTRAVSCGAGPDFQVRSGTAIRGDQTLVNCPFCFCWDTYGAPNELQHRGRNPAVESGGNRAAGTVLAAGTTRDTRLASPLDCAAALVADMVESTPPPQLQALINSVTAGNDLHLYDPN
jgi:hypothetical protein